MRGWQVKLCDPLKTRAYLSVSVMVLTHKEASAIYFNALTQLVG